MEHFKEHDLDGSGKITYDEFMKERKKELGDLFDQTEQTAIFDEADKDKTNTITIAEACPSNSLRPGGTSPDGLLKPAPSPTRARSRIGRTGGLSCQRYRRLRALLLRADHASDFSMTALRFATVRLRAYMSE